jgi:hypothetical protein
MPESLIALTPGSGAKNARTFSRSILSNTVEEQAFFLAEPNMAAYEFDSAAISAATAASHMLQIMAGGSLNLYIRWIAIWQLGLATAAAIDEIDIFRLTTAGTGGGGVVAAPIDTSDAAAGAAGMTLPTVKGTEGVLVHRFSIQWTQTIAAQSGGRESSLIGFVDFEKLRGKALRVPLGATNGIAVKNVTARAAATAFVIAAIGEAPF